MDAWLLDERGVQLGSLAKRLDYLCLRKVPPKGKEWIVCVTRGEWWVSSLSSRDRVLVYILYMWDYSTKNELVFYLFVLREWVWDKKESFWISYLKNDQEKMSLCPEIFYLRFNQSCLCFVQLLLINPFWCLICFIFCRSKGDINKSTKFSPSSNNKQMATVTCQWPMTLVM